MKKAQAALDFLMTYGWALLLIVLVVGALFALGIFDVGSFLGSKASGFAQVGIVGWKLADDGAFTAKFENHAGSNINVTSINATLGTESVAYNSTFNVNNGQQSSTIAVGTFSSPGGKGTSYSINVNIAYTDKKTGFAYTDAGTITGKVS